MLGSSIGYETLAQVDVAARGRGELVALDAATGKPLWKTPFSYGRNCMGSPVWADDKIYVGEVQSRFHILKPGADSQPP